jgi:aminoglycoside 3-N-acetyltransferase
MADRRTYDRDTLVEALREIGLREGDLVFSHVGLGMLGYPREGRTEEAAFEVVTGAFREVLGDGGTWVVPTYSYTYTKRQVYDPATSPSTIGAFTELFRKLPGVRRSIDPNFSVGVLGPLADEIIADLPREHFGRDSVYDRLIRLDAKQANVGVGFRYATFVHHVEQMNEVPYRYLKRFSGTTVVDGEEFEDSWLYAVTNLDIPDGYPDLRRLEADARARGLVASARVGFGELTCIRCRDLWQACVDGIAQDPWYLTKAGAHDWTGERRGEPEAGWTDPRTGDAAG